MSLLQLWNFLEHGLQSHGSMGLLVVVDSQGSSPGRIGFKMALTPDGDMLGSIGGGIMEHKLVEWMHQRLAKQLPTWEIRQQIHSKAAPSHQSGMICSGQQTIALLRLGPEQLPLLKKIRENLAEGNTIQLTINQDTLSIRDRADSDLPSNPEVGLPMSQDQSLGNKAEPNPTAALEPTFHQSPSGHWNYRETLGINERAYVIGAGHVGLAMCQVLAGLNFHVINIDDRPGLNTMQANTFAHQKIVCAYPDLAKHVLPGPRSYVIVMTFGYRGDDEAIRALLGMPFGYLGMMGSQAKVNQLLQGLRNDGFPEAAIDAIYSPAGLVHHCKTPMEIAISIAAEIVQVRSLGIG